MKKLRFNEKTTYPSHTDQNEKKKEIEETLSDGEHVNNSCPNL